MLIDDVIKYLESKGYNAIATRFSDLVGREGICIRDYSSTTLATYFNGKQNLSCIYQVIVRKQFDEYEALRLAETLSGILNGANINATDYEFNGQEIYTVPQELKLDESGFYCYEFKIVADITTHKE